MESSVPRASVISLLSNPFLSQKTDGREVSDVSEVVNEKRDNISEGPRNAFDCSSKTAENMSTFSESCSNCNATFASKDDRITLVYIDGPCQNISIPVALAFVFESRGKDDDDLSEESVFLQNANSNRNSQFPLCLKCSCSLRSLYKAFRQFAELRNLESLIAKTLEEISTAETVQQELLKRKVKESENDSFSLFNIKIEADDCLTNLDLIDDSFDPNLAFPDINSDSEGFDDNYGDGDNSQTNLESNDESEPVVKVTRPRRNVPRKRYSDTEYGLDSPDEDPEKSNYSESDDDEDFKPERYVEDNRGNNLSTNKYNRTKSAGERKSLVKIKEEPLDGDEDGVPWCPHCSKGFKNVDSLQRHLRRHKKENDALVTCNLCSETFQSENLLHSHIIEVHGEGEEGQDRTSSGANGQVVPQEILPIKKGADGLFLCSTCPKGFKSIKNLKRHVRVHIKEYDSLLTCQICQKKFSRKEHLTRHITNVHEKKEKAGNAEGEKANGKKRTKEKTDEEVGEQEYSCPHCNKVLKSSDSLRRHVRVHTDEDNSRLICKICNRKFTREHHLSRHCASVHGKVVVLESRAKKKSSVMKLKRDDLQKCPVCSESFPKMRRGEFKDHVKSHGVENPWTCSQCSKSYAEINRLRQHLARVHHEGRAVYSCDICDLSFGFKHILAQHQAELHIVPNNVDVDTLELMAATILSNSESKSSYVCSICPKEYSRKERLTTHMLKHTRYAPHTCDICEKKFLLERSLKIHALLHNNQSPYVCEVCDRRFARADHLKRHSEVKHKDGKPTQHVCDVCGKEYNQLHKLKMHQISHTDERPWSCPKCDKRFNHPSSLLAHKTTHEEERKFCCSTCGRTFKRWCHLRDHEALHADNIPRPFACVVPGCGKTFKRAKDLRNHSNVHSGVKDNICEICGAAFNRIDNLRAHVKAIHLKDDSVRRRPNKRKNENTRQRETVVRRTKNREDLQVQQHPMPTVTGSDFVGYSYPYFQPFPHPPQ